MDSTQTSNDRVKKLAETLRSNGLAASDTQAMEMAKSMAATDEKVMDQANRNKSSMIQNYDVNKPAATIENPLEQPAQSQQKPSNQTWEKEETAQDNSAPERSPAPSSNQALDTAITNVQEQFKQTTQVNPELPPKTTLEEATETTPELIQEAPVATPEPIQEPTTPEIPTEQTPEPATEAPVATPNPIVENPLPVEEPTAPEIPTEQTPEPATEAPAPIEAPIEDNQPEQTQEIPTTPPEPEKDNSHMAESKIQLADVFNVNK